MLASFLPLSSEASFHLPPFSYFSLNLNFSEDRLVEIQIFSLSDFNLQELSTWSKLRTCSYCIWLVAVCVCVRERETVCVCVCMCVNIYLLGGKKKYLARRVLYFSRGRKKNLNTLKHAVMLRTKK